MAVWPEPKQETKCASLDSGRMARTKQMCKYVQIEQRQSEANSNVRLTCARTVQSQTKQAQSEDESPKNEVQV